MAGAGAGAAAAALAQAASAAALVLQVEPRTFQLILNRADQLLAVLSQVWIPI